MSKHTPGPWRAFEVTPISRAWEAGPSSHWEVHRDLSRSISQALKDSNGRTARFPSQSEAVAAIAQATGEQA